MYSVLYYSIYIFQIQLFFQIKLILHEHNQILLNHIHICSLFQLNGYVISTLNHVPNIIFICTTQKITKFTHTRKPHKTNKLSWRHTHSCSRLMKTSQIRFVHRNWHRIILLRYLLLFHRKQAPAAIFLWMMIWHDTAPALLHIFMKM